MKSVFFTLFFSLIYLGASGQDLKQYLINPPQKIEIVDTCNSFSFQNAAYINNIVTFLNTQDFNGELKLFPTPNTPKADIVLKIDSTSLKPQGYSIKITPSTIELIGHDPAGLFYAKQTLLQILLYAITENKAVPCLKITDWPNFERRGVMLDVSRDKVPTMETMYQLIDKFSSWKLNELQLYIEHTFAYKNHEEVWKNASPFTPGQIKELDAYCKKKHIDLVPNQNSFGHMENWLKYDTYLDLAECPTDCKTIWGNRKRTSLNPVDPRSFELMKSLYEELLPNFSSNYFNIGGDETVELCLGKSKEACEKIGKGEVYLEYLKKLNNEVNRQGYEAQFWGDIILNHPELIDELPKNMTALVWGYSASYPFDENLPKFKNAGIDFYVCPGTSTWRSEIGRNDNAFENLKNAAVQGQKNNAKGYLNTNWGDYGHFQPLSVTYAPLLVGAAYSWNYTDDTLGNLEFQLNHYVFEDATGNTGKAILKLGDAYLKANIPNGNANAFHLMLRRYMWTMKGHYQTKHLTIQGLEAAEKEINDALDELHQGKPTAPDADIILKETEQAANLAKHGIHLGIARLKANGYATENIPQNEKDSLINELQPLIDKHQEYWLLRNRIGGLEDSTSKLNDLLEYYKK
ncbi:beta-N-acetylhexosaminidase [Galbibacter pacificus]|uniref:Family 20 glycosylhydrolase n=1 Tax=Galbibacter pacificus TaxID=2996052 RepID=A0ABT6FQ50_9FLAO|nr:family 20 glycosylhydrolase [Galbibacter pacificus]MDG3582151.1 family 20 glycosylhydrolase [Galbibacter pacificus]MDG3585373.1 family 20 glycosylhydrolase [Galbibacter pacificus]